MALYKNSRSSFDWSREATTLLIELYKQHPCLYLPTMTNYHNRSARKAALKDITNKFNESRLTNLKTEDIKKKIHGIRTQFLAELNKMKRSKSTAASADELYVPKLWCFELLHFLSHETRILSQGVSTLDPLNIEIDTHHTNVEVLYDEDVANQTDIPSPKSEDLDFSQFPTAHCSSREESRCSSRTIKLSESSKSRKRHFSEIENISGMIQKAVNTLKTISEEKSQKIKRHELFGQLIVHEMEAIEDEDLLDELKTTIMNEIFKCKKKQRILYQRAH